MVPEKPKMNYASFESQIVAKYGVDLAGWPVGLQFTNPGGLARIGDLRCLRDGLMSGDTRWVRLSDEEWNARKQAVRQQETRRPAAKRRKISVANKDNEIDGSVMLKDTKVAAAQPRNGNLDCPASQTVQDMLGGRDTLAPAMKSLRNTAATYNFNQVSGAHNQVVFITWM